MSFILDALKKSETDRQQQGNAEFAAVPIGPRATSVPRWLWIVGVLLAINLAVLIGLLLQPDSSPSTTPGRIDDQYPFSAGSDFATQLRGASCHCAAECSGSTIG